MASRSSPLDQDIAVIGMACRFPGAPDYDSFWKNLVAGVSSISEIPAERWDWRSYWGNPELEANKTDCRWGGFIDHAYRFDAPFFKIMPREAALMDPQQRVLLELTWACLEDSGYAPLSFAQSPTGVFIGVCNYDHKALLDRSAGDIEGYYLTGTANAIIPNRISQFFDFQGPSLSVDTACSSSLFALDQAIKAIHAGECTSALAGGVNLLLSPERFVPLSQLGMISKTGQCRSFDAEADGYIRGEGAGLVMLKTLRQARQDGDRILGVIKRCEVNHGGKARSLTSPSMYAQARLIAAACTGAGIDPGTITYIEAHGTGTPLGDPIEIHGLKRAFAQLESGARRYCGIGTVKSNIGHLEGAAGVAGLIKTLLCLRHRQLPPLASFRRANPKISLENSPFYLMDTLRAWEPGRDADGRPAPRRAGISSFGFGGSNAHVLVEEYLEPAARRKKLKPSGPVLALLSAANEDRLRESARRLAVWLETNPALDLRSVAHTLQVGRQAMAERLAWVGSEASALRVALATFAAGGPPSAGVHRGRADSAASADRSLWTGKAGRQVLAAALAVRDLDTLAASWAGGAELPTLQPSGAARIALPTYPFAGEEHRLKASEWGPRRASSEPGTPSAAEASKLKLAVASPNPPVLASPEAAVKKRSLQSLAAFSPTAGPSISSPLLASGPVKIDAGVLTIRPVDRRDLLLQLRAAGSHPGVRVIMVVPDNPGWLAAAADPELAEACDLPVVLIAASVEADWSDLTAPTEALGQPTAATVASHPRESLVELKRHLRAIGREYSPRSEPARPEGALHPRSEASLLPRPSGSALLPPALDRVRFEAHPDGIVIVTLAEPEEKNAFSPALGRDLTQLFEYIRAVPDYKVVVLTGSGPYFASGGTKENLLAIQQGRMRFTDAPLYLLGLRCELPVIAALQGHAFGAGWSMGLFCDESILSEESVYCSPYLRYGFTPGAGSTLISTLRLGRRLGWEVLFTAREYSGRELKSRGMPLPVVPRGEVLPFALSRARQLAVRCRADLLREKAERTSALRAAAEAVCEREVALHARTFVGQSEVLSRIESHYGEGKSPAQSSAAQRSGRPAAALPAVCDALRSLLAEELQVAAAALNPDTPFLEMGLDSITGVTWVRRINQRYGLSVAATQIYSHPTLKLFAEHVLSEGTAAGKFSEERLAEASRSPAVSTEPVPPNAPLREPSRRASTDVAIVGLAGRFPMAASAGEFWERIIGGQDCISEVPASRWAVDAYFSPGRRVPGKTLSRWMGVMPGAAEFDPTFFGLSPAEAEQMDPQQRVFLQVCWHCVEDAGYAPSSLSGSRCGVFVGCAPGDYAQRVDGEGLTAQHFMGGAAAILASRISYCLNLRGPSVAIDTACSSSLVALAQACDQLQTGACNLALAGGVNVLAGPGMHLMCSQAGMLSPDGRCFSFDERANGFVPGEGVGVVMLKRRADAERDGDSIYGVIRGWGVNQDGRTNGITAPNGSAQAELEAEVYEKFGINPEQIQLLEAHGTGTRLGDPIEIDALKTAFGRFTSNRNYCALGSVKSNVGHLLTAAGIAGVIKLLLALKHRRLPPTINFERLNSHLELDSSPFYVNTAARDWPAAAGGVRQAAISSFGFSGTNAHLVLAEAQGGGAVKRNSGPSAVGASAVGERARPVLLVLSAKNEDRLREAAGLLRDFLRAGDSPSLRDIAYTLQVGRDAMSHRAAWVVSDRASAAERLDRYAKGGSSELAGPVRPDQPETLPAEPARLEETAARWVEGATVDWAALHAGPPARRQYGLPGYPFAREHYWLAGGHEPSPRLEAAPGLTPIRQTPETGLSASEFSAVVDGTEFFLQDHRVHGRRVLPGVAYLELARAAVAQISAAGRTEPWRLERVVWARPLPVENGSTAVHLRLRSESADRLEFKIWTESEAAVHCQGLAVRRPAPSPPALDLAALRAQLPGLPISAEAAYVAFRALGLEYGPGHRGLKALWTDGRQTLGQIELPAFLAATRDRFGLHPALMDAALQTCLGLTPDPAQSTAAARTQAAFPFALESLQTFAGLPSELWVWARFSADLGQEPDVLKLDLDLCDEAGKLCVRFAGLSLRPGQEIRSRNEPAETLLFEPVWPEMPRPTGSVPSSEGERIVLVCGEAPWTPESIAAALPKARCIRLSSAEPSPEVRYQAQALRVFELLQEVYRRRPAGGVLIQIVAADDGEAQLSAGLFGLLQTAALERSATRGQYLALAAAAAVATVVEALQENAGLPGCQRIRYCDGRRQIQGWKEIPVESRNASAFRYGRSAPSMPWKEGGVYLITGGAGGLGRLFAAEIAARVHSATIILAGRSPLAAAEEKLLLQLGGGGSRIEYRRCDATDSAEVDALLAEVERRHGRLSGVLHAAGAIHDDLIEQKSAETFRQVLAPKVAGAWQLDRATRHHPLDFFALFSSYASARGNAGQADYAAANGFLDSFAAYRQGLVEAGERSGQTCSVNWPWWEQGGMRLADAARTQSLLRTGMVPLSTAAGPLAFYRALASAVPQVAVAAGQPGRMREHWLTSSAVAARPNQSAAAPPSERLIAAVQRALQHEVAVFLKFSPEALDPDAELAEFGFDSITLTDFANRLNETYRLDLTPAAFFEYPTIRNFAAHLARTYSPALAAALGVDAAPPAAPAAAGPTARGGPNETPAPAVLASGGVAIIGISGQFPRAADLDEFWANLKAGRDCISEVPADRWDWKALFGDPEREPNKTNIKWGGFIDGVGDFDPRFFGISPREAELMDPHQRLMMMQVWKAVEDAGYSPESLSGSKTGVFIGTGNSGYDHLVARSGVPVEGFSATGMVPSVGPNRISYLMNWHGPSEPIETACSSSLVAIHRGIQAIASGQCGLAVVGGVSAMVLPDFQISFNKAGMLCEDGRCKTFSAQANGYVRGEGAGILVLKSLQAAEADGDQIYGIIRGAAENHGGRTNSLTAPNPRSQAEVIRDAFRAAGVDVRTVGYIETHGTGTALGDPVEINGLKQAFAELNPGQGPQTPAAPYCGLGSVKTNIGHLELAAGIAGVVKVLLQMKHRLLVKSLHCATVSPYIQLQGSPFYLLPENRPWVPVLDGEGRTLPLRAGVSSFGFGGVNAHVVIEEYIPRSEPPASPPGPVIVVLSAKSEERLKVAARNLLAFLPDRLEVAELAYTLQTGREAMDERLSFVAGSIAEVREKLRAFLDGAAGASSVYRGQAARFREVLADFSTDQELRDAVGLWIERQKWAQLASLWAKGLAIDWRLIYGAAAPRRVSLPTYPFELKRFWVPPAVRTGSSPGTMAAALPAVESTVVIAGAGLFGICLAHHLKQAGVDFVLLEREKGVGGVWYKNTWPGCGCDIPMIAYAYSFLHYQGPVWAKQPDILRYLQTCVERLGLTEHLRLETEVTSAAFDEAAGCWTIATKSGPVYRSQYFCSAMGGLGQAPKLTEIRGRETFAGPVLHALEYAERAPDLTGKRVAIIGNGATQLQMVEALQPRVQQLTVYGRSPKFVYPRATYSPTTEEALSSDPELWQLAREEYLKHADGFGDALTHPVRLNPFKPGNEVKTFFNRSYDATHEEYYQWCRDQGFVPEYNPGCNRPLISATYHQVIRAANVAVIQSADLEIVPTGIRAGEDRREFDVILLCTGYDLNNFRPKCPIFGRGGRSLEQYYGDGYPRGFLTYVPTFPNLILGPGPNSGTNATSITAIYEYFAAQLVRQIEHCREQRLSAYEVREEKVEEFVGFVTRESAKGPYYTGCSSFYRDAQNTNVGIFPGSFAVLQQLFAFDPHHFVYAAETPFSARRPGRRLPPAAALARPGAPLPLAVSQPAAAETREVLGAAGRLMAQVKLIAAEALKIPFEEIDDGVNFQEYGVDSIMMMNITRRLKRHIPDLTADALLRFSSLAGFANYLMSSHRDAALGWVGGAGEVGAGVAAKAKAEAGEVVWERGGEERGQPRAEPARSENALHLPDPSRGGCKDIAVIGMSGRFPGAASLAEFWANLRAGKESVEFFTAEELADDGVPQSDIDHPNYVRAKPRVANPEIFDPLFFSISPTEAASLDPQHRLMLEEAWRALEDAGYPPDGHRRTVGIYLSQFTSTYRAPPADWAGGEMSVAEKFKAMLGMDRDYIATRLAYKFNFTGPAYTVQTACSSSMAALHLCAEALRQGNCEMGLVGGVALTLPSREGYMYDPDLIFSPDGHCRPFAAAANGTIFGEGIGVVVLKRWEDAVRDRDAIYAVIKGSAVNNDGHEKRDFTAPGFSGQTEVIARALAEAAISAERVGLVEAHATGTRLGDPLEFSALSEVYRRHTSRVGYCALGSVKANVGHLNTASGITGFIKTVLCLHHGEIPPLINADELNPDLRLETSPFYINRALQAWPRPEGGRHAAVSSFGIGGTNVHIVMAEPDPPAAGQDRSASAPVPIVLSAKNRDRLDASVRNLLAAVEAQARPAPDDLRDLAFTLQVGRVAMEERLGFWVLTAADLAAKLRLLAEGRDAEAAGLRGRGKRKKNSGAAPAPGRELEHWIEGGEVEWASLPVNRGARRVHLPVYPFAGERFCGRSGPSGKIEAPIETVLALPVWTDQAVSTAAAPYSTRVIHAGLSGLGEIAGWTSLPMTGPSAPERFGEAALGLMRQIQGLMREKPRAPVLLQVLIPAGGPDQLLSGLAGMLRTARKENPLILGQLIAVDPDLTVAAARQIAADNARSPEAAEIQIGRAERRVRGWEMIFSDGRDATPPWKDGGVYLISGGAGGLGLLFAEAIAAAVKQPRLILVGRKSLTSAANARLDRLRTLGARASYRPADLCQLSEVTDLIREIEAENGRLDGVLHAAGLVRDGFLLPKTPATLAEVLGPKVAGTCHLDTATRHLPLDFFILFASTAGALGHAGQADYAAANAYLDGFARWRNELAARGERTGRTLAIDWGIWKFGGMRLEAGAESLLRQRTGLVPLGTARGLRGLGLAWALGESQVLLADGEMAKIRLQLAVTAGPAAVAPAPQACATPLAARPPDAARGDSAALRDPVRRALKGLFAEALELPADRIDVHETLEKYGIDSLMISTLNERLGAVFGEISKTLFFEYQTLAEVADYFIAAHREACRRWLGAAGSPLISAPSLPSAPSPAAPVNFDPSSSPGQGRDPIAIIGLSGHYPQASTLDEFWANLSVGRNCVSEIPPERWPLEDFYQADPDRAVAEGLSYSKWGGFLGEFAQFDSLFFNISPREALDIDPQERLLLQSAWEALEDAGVTRESLFRQYRQRVGVFTGITQTGFNLFGPELRARGEPGMPHTSFSSAANRISYFLNVKGPSLPVDTMCSSSLTAVHEACERLRGGACDLALAGGVNLYLHPSTYVGLCAARMLAPDGKCKSFGQGGNGYVPGEGVGMVVLKRYSEAVRDRDPIHAIIRATEVNHGGKTNGYTVPNPKAQAELIRSALDRAEVNARTVSYIEAHGTGTELGDPVEITGLTQAFRRDTPDTQFCAIGAAKSNLGHLEAAAGIAGLTKIILQLRHRQLAPSLHSSALNPHIAFGQTPFVVQQELTEWSRPTVELQGERRIYPRRAGLSSFGAGGANAHAVVEEAPAPPAAAPAPPLDLPVLIVLSAKNEERLKAVVRKLHEHITSSAFRTAQGSTTLQDLAYTLQVGREPMEERLAFTAESWSGLAADLLGWLENRATGGPVWRGRVSEAKETLAVFAEDEDLARSIEAWIEKRKYSQLLDLWVKGLALDWNRFYPVNRPARIHLPTYPFAPERHWFAEPSRLARPAQSGGGDAPLHPLLQRNTSDLQEQRFSSTFTGREPFFAERLANGEKALTELAALEMALAAVRQADSARQLVAGTALRLSNVVWADPFSVNGHARVLHIGLERNAEVGIWYELYSESSPGGAESIHQQGRARFETANEVRDLNFAALVRSAGQSAIQPFLGGGETIRRLQRLPDERILMEVALLRGGPETLPRSAPFDPWLIQPVLLDAVLQAVGPGRVRAVALDELILSAPCPSAVWVLVWTAGAKLQVDVGSENGEIYLRMRGLTVESVLAAERLATRQAEEWLFLQETWTPAPLEGSEDWSDLLRQAAHQAVAVVHAEDESGAALVQLLQQLRTAAGVATPWQIQSRSVSVLTAQPFTVTPQVVLFLGSGGESDLAAAFQLSRQLMRSVWEEPVRIYYHFSLSPISPPFGAALSGFTGAAMMENPRHRWHLIEQDASDRAGTAIQRLIQEWLSDRSAADPALSGSLFQTAPIAAVRYDHEGRHRRERHTTHLNWTDESPSPFRAGGTYLIAGGGGLIGHDLCLELAAQFQANLVILSRGPADDRRKAQCAAIESRGGKVHCYTVDIGDAAALLAVGAQIRRSVGALHGVLNLATAHDSGLIATQSWEGLQTEIRAKVDGTVNLDRLTAGESLDCFILFSSIGAFGIRGSAGHSYACAFQNEFARRRAEQVRRGERSGRSLALAWGPWESDPVHAAADPARREKIARSGFALLSLAQAFPALAAACHSETAMIGLFRVNNSARAERSLRLAGCKAAMDLTALLDQWEGRRQRGEVLPIAELSNAVGEEELAELSEPTIQRIHGLFFPGAELERPSADPSDQRGVIRRLLADVLKLKQIDDRETFQNYGMDSVSAMVFATRLEKNLRRTVKPEWLIDHPTVQRLARRLEQTA